MKSQELTIEKITRIGSVPHIVLRCAKPDGISSRITIIQNFDTMQDCMEAAALIRASHLMLEALGTAVEAHEKALQITLNQISESGNMVEHIGFPEWYEKAKAAIEAAKNTNETL